MNFSIRIPTWNNLEQLQLCIRSIRENSEYDHQVVVHINEGNDGTKRFLEEEQIEFTHTKENVGVCKAMNTAYSKVKFDHIIYLNDDMYVSWLG